MVSKPTAHRRLTDICLGAFFLISSLAIFYLIALFLLTDDLTGRFSKNIYVPQGRYGLSHVAQTGNHWPRWRNLEYLIVFGDSYSQTGFDWTGEQPSSSNPLGNPDLPGLTSTNGWNWVEYLTVYHNETFLKTLNFGIGGATVDEIIIHPDVPGLKGLATEIEKQFLPTYASPSAPSPAHWNGDNSLFFIWIGINDIGNAKNDEELEVAMQRYIGLVDRLYVAGARNFMFINVPAINRSPHAVAFNMETEWTEWTEMWNADVAALSKNLTKTYPDVTAMVFDSYRLWNDAMDKPKQFPEGRTFINTTGWCLTYVFGTEKWNSKSPDCEYSVDAYLWINDFHPTTVMHNLTAHEVAKVLSVV